MTFDPVKLKIFIMHIESIQDCIVYTYTYPFLWNTWLYVLEQFIFLLFTTTSIVMLG